MNREIEKKLWKKAKLYVSILRIVPFIKMVAVCNNLAFSKVDETSDIDIFIVAKSGRLFIVRTFVTFIFQILGVRRHGSKVAGRFCLSFFIDDSAADLSAIAIDDDIYLAYWVKSMKPIIDRSYASVFLNTNSWIRKYFENERGVFIDYSFLLKESLGFRIIRGVMSVPFVWKAGDFVEALLGKWQIARASRKMLKASSDANLIINEHMLKFHNIDRREFYRDRWFSKYGEKALLTDEKFLKL